MKRFSVLLLFMCAWVSAQDEGNLGPLISAVSETDAEVRTSFFPAIAALLGGIILIALAIAVARILAKGN